MSDRQKMVVKVQVPLAIFGPATEEQKKMCLVYDERRRYATHQDISSAVRKAIGADPKGYFEARWTGEKFDVLLPRLKDRPW